MDRLGIDAGKIGEYSATMLYEVFNFRDTKYLARIKLFNRVIDRIDEEEMSEK